ncbi:MAG: hypothetical protein M1831_003041 [Alyxoria varia]|nr:MAG: hypothetical protein M1831_003041 [Alyxoria varia]
MSTLPMTPQGNMVDVQAVINGATNNGPVSPDQWQWLAEQLLQQVANLQNTMSNAEANYNAMEAENQRLQAEVDRVKTIAQNESNAKDTALAALSQYTNVDPTATQAGHPGVTAPAQDQQAASAPSTMVASQQANDPAIGAKNVENEVEGALTSLENMFSQEEITTSTDLLSARERGMVDSMSNATATKAQTVGDLFKQSLGKVQGFEGKMGGAFYVMRAGMGACKTEDEREAQLDNNIDSALASVHCCSDDRVRFRALQKGIQYEADDMLMSLKSMFPNTSLSMKDLREFYVKVLQCVLWHKGKGFFPVDSS